MRTWLRHTTGGLPKTFWYLWTGTLINRLGSFVVIFLAIYLTSARHFSAAFAGLVIGLYGAGGAAGTLTGGVLADHWGRRRTLLLSHLSGATCMVALGLLTRVRDVPRVVLPAAQPDSLARVFADRVFLVFVGLNLLTALVFLQHISSLPIAMAHNGLRPSTFGMVIALNGVLIVLGQLFIPRLIRDRSHAGVLAVAALVQAAGFGLTAFAHSAVMYAGTVLIWTFGEMLN